MPLPLCLLTLLLLTPAAADAQDPASTVTTLWSAIQAHAWPVVTGAVIVLLVFAAFTEFGKAQWQRIPAQYRPLIPLALGVLSTIGEALIAGKPWADAFARDGLLALLAALYQAKSPTAHLGMVVLPDTPVVQALTKEPSVVIRETPPELTGEVLKNLERDTEPAEAPKGE